MSVSVRSSRKFIDVVSPETLSKAEKKGSAVILDDFGSPRLFTYSEVTTLIATRLPGYRISQSKSLSRAGGRLSYLYKVTVLYTPGNVRKPTGPRPESAMMTVCPHCWLETPVNGECGCGL